MAKKQTNRTPDVLSKYEEVVRLRTLGLSFQAIAERVGYKSRSGAKEAYSKAIELWGGEAVDELRVVENERLDHLWRVLMGKLEIATRDPETSAGEVVSIINSALNLSRRRAQLNGVDIPRRHEITGVDGKPLELTTDIGQLINQRIDSLSERDPNVIEVANGPK
jgi:hypothetical protein